jgi:hypothetical protein
MFSKKNGEKVVVQGGRCGSYSMVGPQHNAFLSWTFHFSLWTCNFCKFNLIFFFSLSMALDYICRFISSSIIYVKGSFHMNLIAENYPKIHFQLLFHSHLSLKIPFCNNFHKWCDYNKTDETKKGLWLFAKTSSIGRAGSY